MSLTLNVHNIGHIDASAYSMSIEGCAHIDRMHCQTLNFRDANQRPILQLILFFEHPALALPIGDRSLLDDEPLALPALAQLCELGRF